MATNLYAATSIAVGTQIRVQNQSEHLVTLADSSAGLARDATGDCVTITPFKSATNNTSATGAWAKAETGDSLINVVGV
ncbi:MAG: hypothetical protein ACRDBQ_22045 [Shewanella sp.]